MRCKSCNYPLWHIKARQCPECGRAFAPSEFEFVINSVRFCCPHCEQEYYGTGEQGHLVPKSFACVNCQQAIDMDQMVLLPAEGVAETQTETDHNPWLWPRNGQIRAWFSTIGKAMVNPGRLIAATPADAPGMRAFVFAGITGFVVALAGAIPTFCFMLFAMLVGGGRGGGMPGTGPVSMALMQSAFSLGSTLAWVFGLLFVITVCAHGLLRITGRCEHGIGRTFQVMCYSSGANLLTLLPCVGWLGSIWWIVSAILMLKEGQRVSGGRASLAVLTVPCVVIAGFIAFVVWIVASLGGGGGPWGSGIAMTTGQMEVESIAVSIRDHATADTFKHAAELMVDDEITPTEFLDLSDPSGNWTTRMNTVRIGGRTLNQWQGDSRSVKDAAAERAADELPPDVVAYRIGDMVFTHSGIDFSSIKSSVGAYRLWTVIFYPESWSSGSTSAIDQVVVGTADGDTQVIPSADFSTLLGEQNDLRKSLGLPPIPAPEDVKSDKPARASDSSKAEPSGDEPPPDGP